MIQMVWSLERCCTFLEGLPLQLMLQNFDIISLCFVTKQSKLDAFTAHPFPYQSEPDLGFLGSMFLKLFSTKRSSSRSARSVHFGKHFNHPNPEDIAFSSICVNLRQRKWKFLDQILSSNLTNSLVKRVVSEFRMSPDLVLGFYKRVGEQKSFSPSLECVCMLIHVMISSKKYDDALISINSLMQTMGYSHLEVLEGLWDSYDSEISSPNVFDSLIRACTSLGDPNSAYDVIMNLRMEKGFHVSVHAWNNFLNRLLKSNEVNSFWKKYAEMISYGYTENIYTLNLVILALCKEMQLYEAISVFYRMLKGGIYPNVVTFNMIINGACKISDTELGLKLFRKMGMMSMGYINPNSITYNCLINRYCKLGDMKTAESLRDEMTKRGIQANLITYATLIDAYLRKGCKKDAFRLCSHMVDKGIAPNNVVYNSIIHWLFFEGDTATASVFLSYMIKSNICFDKFTNSILVTGLSRNGYLHEALGYHKWLVLKNLVDKDLFLENTLLYYLFRSGNESILKVKQVLDDMIDRGLDPDTITYGTMIDGFSKQGSISNAIRVYDDMIKEGKKPNLVIYNSIVDGLSKNLSVDLAKIMVDELKKLGLFDVVTLNSLLNGFCANWKVNEALNLFLQMQEGRLVNEVTYNILVNFFCKIGSVEEGKEVMEMMVAEGVAPDSITYTILVMNACKSKVHCYSREEVIELHDDMVVKGVKPDSQTYDKIVGPLIGEESIELS